MKITILTLGTRGDVQPYVALGQALIEAGHSVVICTGPSFKGFIEGHGVGFYPSSLDFMELLKTDEGQAIFNGSKIGLSKMLKFVKEIITPGYKATFKDFLKASEESDLIIYHPKALGAVDVAEYLKIPCIDMPPVPMIYPIKEFPSLAVSPNKNFGGFLNKLTYATSKFGESSTIKAINAFRVDSLNLKKRKTGSRTYKVNNRDIPIVYPISNALFKDVTSWNNHVTLPGFFFMDIKQNALDEHVEAFLEEGEKPVVISFSSMPLKDPNRFKDMIIEALKKTGDRAIVLTGISGLEFQDHDHILTVEKAPHRLLFKRAKGIIHHGGVGTMAEALLSGAPQVIMPFNVDQPFWANRLYKQGLALEPLNEKTLTVNHLVNVFKAFGEDDRIEVAQNMRETLLKEDGLKEAVNYIESNFM